MPRESAVTAADSPAVPPAVPAPRQPADGDLPSRLLRGDGPWALALFVLVAAFHFPAMQAGFVWDDSIILTSKAVREWSGLWQLWFETDTTYEPDNTREGHFWPIVYSSFWLEHKLWGFAPLGYHLVNLLLHCVNTWLVWRLLRHLAVPGAWLAAAVFGLHPVHVEAVVWVIARKDLLSTLFYLAAALMWLRFVEAPRVGRYLCSLGGFVAALLSKTIAVSLPAALLVARWWRHGRVTTDDLLRVLPFFVLGLFIALNEMFFFQARVSDRFDLSLVDRFLIASRAVWFYLGKLLWPTDLAVIYPRWEIDPRSVEAWLWPVAGAALVAALWLLRGRLGRGPLAGAVFFAVTLAPVLGFVDNIYMKWSFVADRYQYLASLGVIAVVVGAATVAVKRLPEVWRRGGPGVAAALLATLGILTWQQAGIYRDAVVFNSHIVALNPVAREAWLNLGAALSEEGRHEEALEASRIAIEQRPDSVEAHVNAGHALIELGRHEEAEQVLRRGLGLQAESRFVSLNLHLNLAAALERQGGFDEALEMYDRAIEIAPEHIRAVIPRSGLLLRMGRYRESLAFLEESSPTFDALDEGSLDHARMRVQMSMAARALGRLEEAADHRRRALESAPSEPEAFQGMAESLREVGRLEEAIEWYGLAVERAPGFALAWAGMGDALFEMGRHDEAMERLERAESLLPADSELAPDLHRLIGRTRAAQGRAEDAEAAFRRVLELSPGDLEALRGLVALHFDREAYAEALAALHGLLEVTPEDADVHSDIGVVLYYLGRSEEALARFDHALSLDPTSASARASRDAVLESLQAGGPRDSSP